MKTEELEKFSGKDGNPMYVAVHGKVYDVSGSKLWKDGKHMNRHPAGVDLSGALSAAPHGAEVLERFKQVDSLEKTETVEELPAPAFIVSFVQKYPFFKRHPHPMVVHFPMTFFITVALFLLFFYLINPLKPMLDSIFYLHVLGTISLPFAIFTGWLSWKINYLGKPMGHIKWKIFLSTLVLIFDVIVLVSLIQNPELLIAPQGIQLLIPVMIFSYLPIISLIGYHGGQLVY